MRTETRPKSNQTYYFELCNNASHELFKDIIGTVFLSLQFFMLSWICRWDDMVGKYNYFGRVYKHRQFFFLFWDEIEFLSTHNFNILLPSSSTEGERKLHPVLHNCRAHSLADHCEELFTPLISLG